MVEITVVGGISVKYVARGNRLPDPGETVEAGDFHESLDGKGALQAIACARLGARVVLIGKTGKDKRGDFALARLEAEGVDVSHVSRDATAETGAIVRMTDSHGSWQEMVLGGANLKLRPSEIRRAVTAFRRAAVTLLTLEPPMDSVVATAELAAGCDNAVILDPTPLSRGLPERVLRLTDLIKLGSREAQRLTGFGVFDRQTARIAGERLLWLGVPRVLIEGGNHGSLLLEDDLEWWFPRSAAQRAQADATRDAMTAGIAVGKVESGSWKDAVLFGAATAEISAKRAA